MVTCKEALSGQDVIYIYFQRLCHCREIPRYTRDDMGSEPSRHAKGLLRGSGFSSSAKVNYLIG
ncbi:hypothetical protein SAMN02982997_01045 [Legionella micdadei]|uniref:Uncharacterized protein n=1 Tax=Legionella micdadei TaxID=451 RepID=A0A1G5DYR7_LEGMI|nr:hypothetical protein Lmic_2707 [Legionella micdadei]SCY19864.1 hypothetical protein SAMN02982997_01045 [Legionella micdadei]